MQLTEELKKKKYRLLLIIGRPGSGKSKYLHNYSKETGIPVLNLDDIIGKQLPEGKSNDYVYKFMNDFIKSYSKEEFLLDKKAILYHKDSGIDLLPFLENLAKEKVVIATWNGYTKDGKLYHLNKEQEVDFEYELSEVDFAYIELL